MSDNNIPFEIQLEIIQRIPDTKSLIRCRSLSKAWRSEIDSTEFVTAHTLRHHQAHNRHHHLLIRTQDRDDKKVKYVSIVDDDTFPHQKHNVFVPDSVDKLNVDFVTILGGSHGLFCLYEPFFRKTVIWNPSIRKTVDIPVPNEPECFTNVGFGICPSSLDVKLVKITYPYDFSRLKDVNASTQVKVFTLSSGGTWRSPLSSNLPHKLIWFGSSQAVVDGFIYWDAVDRINVDDRFTYLNLIMSFDLTTEEFTKVKLPDSLALNQLPDSLALYQEVNIRVSYLRKSLAVIRSHRNIYHVWMMNGHGCTRSFNKLYSIHATDVSLLRKTLGFRKSGAPIIELNHLDHFFDPEHELAIYEPESKNVSHIGIYGSEGKFFVHSYKETLLLLGQQ